MLFVRMVYVPPCDIDCSGQDISGTGIARRGVLHCSKKPDWATVTPQTENNLFTHFVSAYLPTTPALPFPMLATNGISGENLNYLTYGFIDVSGVDASGTIPSQYSGTQEVTRDDVFPDPLGLYSPFSNTCRPGSEYDKTIFKHKHNQTMIRGDSDINGYPTVCQGGNKTNLSWGNNTKQNYLIAYDPRKTKVRFNICPAKECWCQEANFDHINWVVGDQIVGEDGGSVPAPAGGTSGIIIEIMGLPPLTTGGRYKVSMCDGTRRLYLGVYYRNLRTGAGSTILAPPDVMAAEPPSTPVPCVCGGGAPVRDCCGNITYPVCPC